MTSQLGSSVGSGAGSRILWSLVDSQATGIVLGSRTPDEAVATVDYHLDRLFRR